MRPPGRPPGGTATECGDNRHVNRQLAAALTVAALLWAGIVLAAPYAFHRPALAVPTAVAYAAASRFCHQRPERTFYLHDAPMPVCARCAGIYLSAGVGVLLGWSSLGRFRNVRVLLVIAALPTGITWALEHLGGVPLSNLTRHLAALPLGAAAGWVFIRMLRYDSRLHGDKNSGR